MTVIRRDLAEKIAADLDQMYVRDGAERYEPVNMRRVVEHVLIAAERDRDRGAVERLNEWADSLDFYAGTHGGSPEMVRAVAVEMRAAALDAAPAMPPKRDRGSGE